MFQSLSNVLKIKDLRKKISFTFFMVLLVRLGSQIPVPGINVEYFKQWFAQNSNDAFNIFSAFTGGSFERMSILALGITPFITASIVIQLLTIVFPSLEELSKDGDYGKKKMDWINRFTAVGLALLESIAMAIGFGRSGLFPNMTVLRSICVVFFLTLGCILMIVGSELINKKGIGNGVSIILMVNILSGLPGDFAALFETFVSGKTIAKGILSCVVILGITLGTVILVILLNEACHKVPVQYSNKFNGRKMQMSRRSFIPIKINPASVIPVIFASSILSIPQMIAAILGRGYGSGFSAVFLNMTNQNNWFDFTHPEYTLGLVFYIIMIYFFAYFYTSISFNPVEIADNLKKQGGCVPGIRQGRPTEEYFAKILHRLLVIGTTGLIVVVLIPIFFSGVFHANVSFGGTSLIIIVGVILETLGQIESQMQVRKYSSFLAG